MKQWSSIVIVLSLLLFFLYFGQAQRAVEVKKVRLGWELEDGTISPEEYNKQFNRVSLWKMLLDPGYVFKAGSESDRY